MTYELALFDFDGTLADSFGFFVASHDALARRHGFATIDRTQIEEFRGLEPREIMRRQGVPLWKMPFIARDFMTMMARDGAAVRAFDGVADALRTLARGGMQLAIVTSNSEDNVRRVLGPGVMEHIRVVDSGADMFGKRRRLERVAKRCGAVPRSTIYIGDQTTDARAARAAGMAFGAVLWGYASAGLLARQSPEHTFERVADLGRLAASHD
jgi:phosphoglycolate phosphatase